MVKRRRRAKPPIAGFGVLLLVVLAVSVPFLVGASGCGQTTGGPRTEPMELGGTWQGMRLTPSDSGTARALGVPPGVAGVVVADVNLAAGSRAAHAGIARGDVLVAVDGKPITNLAELYTLSLSQDITVAAQLSVLRAGQPMAVVLPPTMMPAQAMMPAQPMPAFAPTQIAPAMTAPAPAAWSTGPTAAAPAAMPMQPVNPLPGFGP